MSTPPSEPKASKMLDLSDALHNFRSAFDAVAWGMAHFNSAAPTRPKSVNFPICSLLTQRDKALKDWVGDIHPQFQERLRIMQPFTYISSAGQVNLLSMLHDLGIQDKHRDILEVSDDFQGIGIDGSIIEYEDRDVLPTAPRVDMHSGVKFVDGVVVGTIYAGASIRSVDGVSLRPTVKVQLAYGDRTYDVMPIVQQFVRETRRYLDLLLFGLAAPDERDGAGWVPLEEGPPT